MELRTPAASENRAISGSPSGVPSPVSLSLRIKTLQQHRASDHADKGARNGHQMSLRGVSFDYARQSLAPLRTETLVKTDIIFRRIPYVWHRRIYRVA